jgi:hypothetical protein
VGLLLGLWLMVSAVSLRYPFTLEGVDARQRDMGFGLGMTLVAVGWVRRARTTGPVLSFVAASAVLACALVALSWIVGYEPSGSLALAWWNER